MKNDIRIHVLAGVLTLASVSDVQASPKPVVAFQKDAKELTRPVSGGVVTSYADVLDRITPSVVSITVERRQVSAPEKGATQRDLMEEFLRRFYGIPPAPRPPSADPSQPPREQFIPEGAGSGFIISADGLILTNSHVVSGAEADSASGKRVRVQLFDGREFEASIVGNDRQTDIAVLRIDATGLPVATLGNSRSLRVGDVVFAIGNPLSVGLTVSQGIVSAVNRTDLGIIGKGLDQQGVDTVARPPIESFIQTDAAINMGNSGGPLADAQGRVIGINSAITSIGGGSIGIGFAIPAHLAERVVQELVAGGNVRRGYLGVTLEPLDAEKARAFGLDRPKGVIVTAVQEGLPAAVAGVQRGDVVLAVEGEEVDSVNDMIYLISIREPGSTVKLNVFRWGKRIEIPVKLGDREALIAGKPYSERVASSDEGTEIKADELVPGLKAALATEELRRRFRLPPSATGLIVTEVVFNESFATTLLPGMEILEINNTPVKTIQEARAALKARGSNAVFARNGEREFYHVLKIR